MFVAAFTVIGSARAGYDWRRLPVSSLAIGPQGWTQRANFIVAGVLYTGAARALGRCPRRTVGPRAVPALVAGVGLGLVGSGVFVTDPMGGFPSDPPGEEMLPDAAVGTASTREGRLHNLCAIPIFAGIPLAALAGVAGAVRQRDYRWACYSSASSVAMVGSFLLFGRAFGPESRLAGTAGVFQRLSIAIGFVWLAALSRRASRHGV